MRETDCIGVISGAAAHHGAALKTLAILPLRLKSDVGPVGMVWDQQEPSPALCRVLQALRDSARP
jgi:hypothetical protein